MKFVNNDKGMTLAEVLIAAGITTVMSLAMSTMMVNTVRVQKKTDDKNTSINFQQSLNSRIVQSNQCEEVLNLASPPSYDPPTGVTAASSASQKQDLLNYKVDLSKLIVDGSDVNVGDTIPGTRSMKLAAAALRPVARDADLGALASPTETAIQSFDSSGTLVNYTQHNAYLEVIMQRTSGAGGGEYLKPQLTPVKLFTNSSNNVAKCGSEGERSVCEEFGGTWDPNGGVSGTGECQIQQLVGGCYFGGMYTVINNGSGVYTTCGTGNPYTQTQSCSCPSGFSRYKATSYKPSKGQGFVSYQCLQCTSGSDVANNYGNDNVFDTGIQFDIGDEYEELYEGYSDVADALDRQQQQQNNFLTQSDLDQLLANSGGNSGSGAGSGSSGGNTGVVSDGHWDNRGGNLRHGENIH